MRQMLEAGVHFGHQTRRWNPHMRRYIFTARNGIHILDLAKTVRALDEAVEKVREVVSSGEQVLFVGTKKQARRIVEQEAERCGMPYISNRWLGGTLTNFRTIRSRLKRLEELERIEESGEIVNYSKKMESQLRRERKKILRNLEGIRNMGKLPGAMVVIDVKREMNAIMEAKKLGIPTICLIDTDGDPDLADIPIPGNDDSMRSIDVIIRELCAAVVEGKNQRVVAQQAEDETRAAPAEGAAAATPRRSRRAMFLKDEPVAAGPEEQAEPGAEAAAPVGPNQGSN